MPQGSFRHVLDYPWGLLSALDLALGEKADEQDELMNVALMLTKNNMKDDRNHALFCEPMRKFMGKITSKGRYVYLQRCASPPSEQNKGPEQTR